MKKCFIKIVSVFVAILVIFSAGIPVFAQGDFEHMRGGYGNWSGVDQRIAVWSLDICSLYARSNGYFITSRATGMVSTGAQASYNWTDNSGANSSTSFLYGDGEYAEVFFDSISYTPGSCQHNQIGYGSDSGSDSQTNWALSVTTSAASSSGYVVSPYTGNVYCYTDVNDSTVNSSTSTGSNTLTSGGDGYAAGISFSNILRNINFTISEAQSGYGYKTDVYQQAHWSLSVSSSMAQSFGYLDSGYTGMVWCGVRVNGTNSQNSALNSNSISRTGNGEWATIYITML